MLRSLLLYLSRASWAQKTVIEWPVARRVARRYVAGETLEEAIQVAQELQEEGLSSTLAHLGEDVTDAASAAAALNETLRLIEAIHRHRLTATASVKLTHFGLMLDDELCLDHMRRLAEVSGEAGVFVRIDMEESYWVDPTLRIHRALNAKHVGLVFQSMLKRSEADTQAAIDARTPVRLVKGAYLEPPEIAYQHRANVDASFDRMTRVVLEGSLGAPDDHDGRWPPLAAVATHDEERISFAENLANELGVPKRALEFQLLYGIRRGLQRTLRDDGYPVRVYVPYGVDWYPYLMRRIAERPANLAFVVTSSLRR